MSHDIPAEYLPPLPSNRNRLSTSGTRDARVESMMAAMQQRPASVSRQDTQSMSSRPASMSRPLSISQDQGAMSSRPISQSQDTQNGGSRTASFAFPEDRRTSMSSQSSAPSFRPNLDLRDSEHPQARSSARVEDAIPLAMAMPEDPVQAARIRSFSHSTTGNPVHDRLVYENERGNRNTLTLTDEELAKRLQEQFNSIPVTDGEVVTAEIIQQEVLDRRNAAQDLENEIANLESQLLSRRLEASPTDVANDAGELNDEAFRIAMMNQQKLDYMRPTSFKPYFSLVVFVVTTITMCVEIAVNGGVEPFSTNPVFGPKPEVLLLMGAKSTSLILAGDWWRLFTPIILHGGILHLVFNMLGLWNIGVPMEREFGGLKIAPIYLLSGFFGVLLSCLFVPSLTSVGASGAIFGLFGAAWADLIQNWSLYKGSQIKMLIQLAVMTAFNLALGIMPFLDNFAHIGGMICGLILGLVVLIQTRYYYSGVKKRKRNYQICLAVVGAILIPFLFIGGYCLLFLEVPINCAFCKYLTCVPMPPNYPYDQRWWNCDDCSQGGLSGSIGTNNTLIFTCPNTDVEIQQTFPLTTTITSGILVETCVNRCL